MNVSKQALKSLEELAEADFEVFTGKLSSTIHDRKPKEIIALEHF